jgi:hypothetical protein
VSSSETKEGNHVQKKTRALLTIASCAAGLMAAAPAAMADEPEAALNTPIHADDGTVLSETVRPGESAAGEQTCKAPRLFNPLVAFKDTRDYFIAPAGDFEDPSLPGWQLTGGAEVTSGGSAHAVTGAGQASSLSLPPGSSATSPEMCVDLNYPSFRFFASQFEAETDSDLAIDVIYPSLAKDNVREAKKFRLKAKDGWRLSDDIKLDPQRLGKRSGWRRVAIRFRVEPGKKSSAYRVDDVLIDPRRLN